MTSQHDGVQYSLCGALANQQGPLMTCPHLRGAGGLGVDVAVCLQGTGGLCVTVLPNGEQVEQCIVLRAVSDQPTA